MKYIKLLLMPLLLIILIAATPISSHADDLIFPFTLETGTYDLEVPENDSWKIFNQEAWRLEQLKFAELKLQIEELNKTHEIELEYAKLSAELEVKRITEINDIKENYFNDRIKTLEDRNKKLQRAANDSFLGIPNSTIWFVLGAIVASQIK